MSDFIQDLWQRLAKIEAYQCETQFICGGISGKVVGTVEAKKPQPETIYFIEKGRWLSAPSCLGYTHNRYCWTLHEAHIELSQQRQHKKVSLVHFRESEICRKMVSSPYHCGSDSYQANIAMRLSGLILEWQIIGKAKQGSITIKYF